MAIGRRREERHSGWGLTQHRHRGEKEVRQGQRTQMIQKGRAEEPVRAFARGGSAHFKVCLDSPQELGHCPVGYKGSSKDFQQGVTWSVLEKTS